MSKESIRKKAEELGAADAGALIATVPYLERLLSPKNIREIQTVIDAAVLNPMHQKQFDRWVKDNKFRSHDGKSWVINEAKKSRAHKTMINRQIRVPKDALFIRLNYRKMLTVDALTPRTKNPDEAVYLSKVRHILHTKGVYLVLKQHWLSRVWEFSFSLGRWPIIPIETDDAHIDREELLGTTMLRKGYHNAVLRGYIRTKLDGLHRSLARQIASGESVHFIMWENRRTTNRTVVGISDLFGSANFPDRSIFYLASELNHKAWEASRANDVQLAQAYLVFAGLAVEYAADLLIEYRDDTIDGAEIAVKILKVAKFAGEVAEVGLTLVGIRTDIVKMIAVGGIKKVLKGKAKAKAIDRLAEEYAKELGIPKEALKVVNHVKTLSSSDK